MGPEKKWTEFYNNFIKCWPTFKFLSLAHTVCISEWLQKSNPCVHSSETEQCRASVQMENGKDGSSWRPQDCIVVVRCRIHPFRTDDLILCCVAAAELDLSYSYMRLFVFVMQTDYLLLKGFCKFLPLCRSPQPQVSGHSPPCDALKTICVIQRVRSD